MTLYDIHPVDKGSGDDPRLDIVHYQRDWRAMRARRIEHVEGV